MRWYAQPQPEAAIVSHLCEVLGVPKAVAEVLAQRGIDSFDAAKAFFRPQWSALHDPFLMLGMVEAVARIQEAIDLNEKILVYGDYDVDGTTAVALLASYLKTQTAHVDTYIPDRYSEGYGLSEKGVQHAAHQGYSLLITLDCGIKAVALVAKAQSLGVDTIICDHHLPGEERPPALAILDPKQPECPYPYKELCGCGIGFKLIQALEQEKGHSVESLSPYLDLVATAIAADIVPLTGENRVLAYLGLQQINKAPRPGLAQLMGMKNIKQLQLHDLVFVIAPRINAAGRMEHGQLAVALLSASTPEIAQPLAEKIEQRNTERKTADEAITKEALEQAQNLDTPHSTVVKNENWHKGVIGIVASRLIETRYCPTVVVTLSGEKWVGSVRSVKGFNVYEALEACSDHLLQFGGHKYAAGLTLEKSALSSFSKAFEAAVKARILPEQLVPSQGYEIQLGLEELTPKLYRIIEQMAPFGPQNMRPVFLTSGLLDTGGSRVVGKDQSHLKLEVTDGSGRIVSGIGFGMAHHYPNIQAKKPFAVLYTLEENEFNGQRSLQLKLKDLKFSV